MNDPSSLMRVCERWKTVNNEFNCLSANYITFVIRGSFFVSITLSHLHSNLVSSSYCSSSQPHLNSTLTCTFTCSIKNGSITISIIALLSLFLFSSSSALNVTTLLSSHSDLSVFTNLLISSSVAADLTYRSSLTILVVPNSYLRSSDLNAHRSTNPAYIADVIRYHVLLEYLSWPDLRQIPAAGKLVATLYQTTGRASYDLGAVNITRNPSDGAIFIQSPIPDSSANASILTLIETLPYNVSIFAVNSLLIPYGFDTMASDYRPPLGLNITKALIDGHNFNVVASLLLASGVVEEFEADEGGAGITLFVPTDEAFANLSPSQNLQSLSADMKAVVLRFHVLHSYYPLGSLESIVNPVQPTLATELMGAGRFTLNISKLKDSVAINTGIVQTTVTQTVCDQNPVAIFGVSHVLLPRELFGKNPIDSPTQPGSGKFNRAPSPESSAPSEGYLGSELESPAPSPSLGARAKGKLFFFLLLSMCTGLCLSVC